MLREQSSCLLQSQLEHVWFCELAHRGLLGERPLGEVMLVALCRRQTRCATVPAGGFWQQAACPLPAWPSPARGLGCDPALSPGEFCWVLAYPGRACQPPRTAWLAPAKNGKRERGQAGEPSHLLPLPALSTCLGKGATQLWNILFPRCACVAPKQCVVCGV